jgi:uncharacterized membrane protein
MGKRGGLWKYVQATLVGGVLFLLPLILAAVLVMKGLQLASKITKGLVGLVPNGLMSGEMAQALVGALALLLLAFIAGLLARTRPGQAVVEWLGNTMLASLPVFNFARGFLGGLDEEAAKAIKVVAVPEESGWALGLVFQDDGGDLLPVFLPGVPNWQSGAMRYCPRQTVVFTDLAFAQMIGLARSMGAGKQEELAKLRPLLQKA